MKSKIIVRKTLAEQTYELLKESIIAGELTPGEVLGEEGIAKQFNVSRTPLKQALTRLEMEGLVTLKVGSPAKVSTFTQEEVIENMELRQILEIYNIEQIINLYDNDFLSKLKENYSDFIEYDKGFHLILSSLNNNKMKKLIHELNNNVYRAFLILSSTLEPSAKEAYKEHKKLLEAIEKKNLTMAKEQINLHLKNVEERLFYYYYKEGTIPKDT